MTVLSHPRAGRRASRPLSLVLAAAIGLGVVACGSGDSGGGDGAEAQTRTVEHAGGSSEVPLEPQRVATPSPVVAGHLASVGVLPVAALDGIDEWLAPYADAGLLHGLDPSAIEPAGVEETDFERLATSAPDLILIEDDDAGQYATFAGIAPTVVISRPTNADWQDAFDQTVAAVGAEDEADEVRDRYADLLAAVPPSTSDTVVTFLRGAGPGQFRLDALGGFSGSVAAEAGYQVDTGRATPEQVQEDVIEYSNERLEVVSGDLLVTTTQAEGGPSSIAELRAGPLWENVPAIRNGRLVELPHSVYNGGTYVAAELLLQALADAAADGQPAS